MQDLVPSTQSFGPFVLLQLAAAVLVLTALAFAVYRGSKVGRSEDTRFQQLFFDGPLVRTMEILRDMLEESRTHTKQLDEIKDKIDDFRNDRLRIK